MLTKNRKVTIIGAGFVGATSAYALMAGDVVDEITLVDINKKLASSQAMDLQHSMAFWGHCKVRAGSFADIAESQVVVITCGANQKPGETRLDLIKKNSAIIADIMPKIFKANPKAIVIMVTNPVDVLTYQAIRMFPKKAAQIFGSGTVLDSARLRYLLGQYFKVNPQGIHAYIIGEHGDSEFPLWSTATIGNLTVREFPGYSRASLDKLFKLAKNAAYTIIAGKQATYYAIGSGVKAIVKAIFGDDHSVLPVSHLLTNYHGISHVALSVPCIVGSRGIERQLKLKLSSDEKRQLKRSAASLKQAIKQCVKA